MRTAEGMFNNPFGGLQFDRSGYDEPDDAYCEWCWSKYTEGRSPFDCPPCERDRWDSCPYYEDERR